MTNSYPVSELDTKFPELEETIARTNSPVFLTKNGHITMVLLNLEQYLCLTGTLENELDKADEAASKSSCRYSGSEVFNRVRGRISKAQDE